MSASADNLLHFRDSGQGRTIVFLHGFMESLDIWETFTRRLSPDFRIVSINLPGHGLSPVLSDVHTMDLMAASVKKVLDALNISTCLLVGHSMGGYVSLAFAGTYPEIVKGLVLFHSHAAADTQQGKENRDRTIGMVRENHINFIKQFIPDLFAPGNVPFFQKEITAMKNIASGMPGQAIISAIEGMKVRKDQLDFLSKTDIPILFIIGKKDLKIPFSMVMEQVSMPMHSEALILENVGHVGFIEAEAETLATIKCFAEKVL
jgi:pimeloyl-ACP methyl ester carboxylesterase